MDSGDYAGGVAQAFQQLAEEALGCLIVASAQDQDVQHDTVLVDGVPETVLLATDADEHPVQEPLVVRLGLAALERVGELPSEAQTPLPVVS